MTGTRVPCLVMVREILCPLRSEWSFMRQLFFVRHASISSKPPFPFPTHTNPAPHDIFHLPRNASQRDIKSRCEHTRTPSLVTSSTIPDAKITSSSRSTTPTPFVDSMSRPRCATPGFAPSPRRTASSAVDIQLTAPVHGTTAMTPYARSSVVVRVGRAPRLPTPPPTMRTHGTPSLQSCS